MVCPTTMSFVAKKWCPDPLRMEVRSMFYNPDDFPIIFCRLVILLELRVFDNEDTPGILESELDVIPLGHYSPIFWNSNEDLFFSITPIPRMGFSAVASLAPALSASSLVPKAPIIIAPDFRTGKYP